MKFLKCLPAVASVLLGFVFVASGLVVLLKLVPIPPPPPTDTAPGQFMAAFGSTGYLTFIKLLEVLGGLLVVIPKTRNLGLLVLGPIIVNILAFHGFIMEGEGLFSPTLIVICVLAIYLLWDARKRFAGLIP